MSFHHLLAQISSPLSIVPACLTSCLLLHVALICECSPSGLLSHAPPIIKQAIQFDSISYLVSPLDKSMRVRTESIFAIGISTCSLTLDYSLECSQHTYRQYRYSSFHDNAHPLLLQHHRQDCSSTTPAKTVQYDRPRSAHSPFACLIWPFFEQPLFPSSTLSIV
ncbi:hypothetical protein BCR44DRAFT_306472 [Catenaria anguillulae PL171]|uniref:Uncharacterized protein n=1 Tax=Catenaria anguillulae PL171 TaxID=765915 RepID=A0A1Y2I6Y9_9FUNG|nr:hypothetical protein BCR44DRAFT_306472 [Catenaria anguillulae PL171]